MVDASKKWQRIQEWVSRDSGAALSSGELWSHHMYCILIECASTSRSASCLELHCCAGRIRQEVEAPVFYAGCEDRSRLLCTTLSLYVGTLPPAPPSMGTAADDAHSVDSTLLELELERTRTSVQVRSPALLAYQSVVTSMPCSET